MSNDAVTKSYVTTLLNCYAREAEMADAENMNELSQALLSIVNMLPPHITLIADSVTNFYRAQKNSEARKNIVGFLSQLKDTIEADPAEKLPLDKALAECSELSIGDFAKKSDSPNTAAGSSVSDLTSAADSFKAYAGQIEGELSEVYQQKYVDTLLLRAEAHLQKGQLDPALDDYRVAFNASHSDQALSQMALIETELGFYEEAIDHYRMLSEIVFAGQAYEWFHTALVNLKKIHEEMIEGDSRRQEAGIIIIRILRTTLDNYSDQINTLAKVTEFESFAQIANDPDASEKLKSIADRIVPAEKERMEREKKGEDRARQLQRQIEGKGRSSELQLSTLLSLLTSEKDNPASIKLINAALKNWIASVVKMDEGKVFIRSEPGMVILAKQGNLLANFYLAKLAEQKNNIQGALSLYARILMSPKKEKDDETIHQNARRYIENCASQTGGTVTKFFSKAYAQYAMDLLSVIKAPTTIADPDTAIEAGLQEKQTGLDGISSYNNYILGIGEILGIKDEAARPLAAVYRRPMDPPK